MFDFPAKNAFFFWQIPESKRQEYETLAMDIFTKNTPKDARSNRSECTSCETMIPDW